MWEELRTRTIKREKYDRDTPLMIVGQVKSIPRVRIMAREGAKTTTSSRKTLTCETSGNIKRVYVDLMPILAAAREPVEEKEREEDEDKSSAGKNKPETSRRNQPSLVDSEEEQASIPEVELPPISVHKPAGCQTSPRTEAPLPPIRRSKKSSESTGDQPGSRPVREEPSFSVSDTALHNYLITKTGLIHHILCSVNTSTKAPWTVIKI